jgi:hypothetical protein
MFFKEILFYFVDKNKGCFLLRVFQWNLSDCKVFLFSFFFFLLSFFFFLFLFYFCKFYYYYYYYYFSWCVLEQREEDWKVILTSYSALFINVSSSFFLPFPPFPPFSIFLSDFYPLSPSCLITTLLFFILHIRLVIINLFIYVVY